MYCHKVWGCPLALVALKEDLAHSWKRIGLSTALSHDGPIHVEPLFCNVQYGATCSLLQGTVMGGLLPLCPAGRLPADNWLATLRSIILG